MGRASYDNSSWFLSALGVIYKVENDVHEET